MNRLLSSLFVSFLLLFVSEASFPQAPPLWQDGGTNEADPDLGRLSRAFERLAEKVRPSVVQIRAIRKGSTDTDGSSERPSNSRGSGFLINSDGYILTAHHVIGEASEIEILLHDRRRLRARLIGGTEAGSEVKLTIFRKGEILQRSVLLAPKPQETAGREG